MIPNPNWRPYVFKSGSIYKLSDSGVKVLFGVLNSYFGFLIQQEYLTVNPVMLIRQKKKILTYHTRTSKNQENINHSEKLFDCGSPADGPRRPAHTRKTHFLLLRRCFLCTCAYPNLLRMIVGSPK